MKSPAPHQLEFNFAPQVSAELEVTRLPSGHVLIAPKVEVRAWGSTQDAASRLGKSKRWVQEALLAGVLHGERHGRSWRVDLLHLEEFCKKSRNF